MNQIRSSSLPVRFLGVASVLLVAACQDLQTVTDPAPPTSAAVVSSPQAARAQFNASVPDVLALPGTVFGDLDESTGQLVSGVENEGVTRGVQNVLRRLSVPTSSYSIRVVEPIRFASSLRDKVVTKVGGLQIHFSSWICTLGFSADHSGGRSFVTASHCSDDQGKTDGTAYFQPTSSVDPTPIAFEVDDPSYRKGGGCSRGKKCRFSDANRNLYEEGVASLGGIGRTSAANNGSLDIVGTFDVTSQDDITTQFANGTEVNKVGRTTGWTVGDVIASCATVNVFGSNMQLFCQTIVSRAGATIIGSGDSGSQAWIKTGDTANLVGIVWGSSGSSTFVFSPLSGVVRELGTLDATTDGVGAGSVPPPQTKRNPTARRTATHPSAAEVRERPKAVDHQARGRAGDCLPPLSWAVVAALALLASRSTTPSDVYAAARPSVREKVVPASISDSVRVGLEVLERVRAGEPVRIVLRLENISDRTLDLYLRGRAIAFDVIITRKDGTVLWRRLEDEAVPAILRIETLKPGAVIELEDTWEQRANGGAPVSAGEYWIRGEILTELEPLVTASASLRIDPL